MDSKHDKQLKAEPPPPRDAELRKMIEEYVADLWAIMDKLRGKLN